MNHKNKRPRESRQMPLKVKYRWRGMAKSNYRKQGKRWSIDRKITCGNGYRVPEWSCEERM